MSGVLYIVATPIGNLGDIGARALAVLHEVDLIAVEDTRHSRRLLEHHGIKTPMQAYHAFNESERTASLLARVAGGGKVALISDAGTPLISDPGYQLVRQAHQRGLRVTPLPGPCAAVAALCAAGQPADRFCFEGFLPARRAARLAVLEDLAQEARTLVFYEAPHRIEESLADMVAVFGAARELTLARELTKTYETLLHGTLGDLLRRVRSDPDQRKGELVLVVAGAPRVVERSLDAATRHTLAMLLEELPLKQAAALAARITGHKKNLLYDEALRLREAGGGRQEEKD